MTTAVIVQARLGSTRLPAKVLLPLPNGRKVLEEVLHRCWCIPGVDVVVAALPDTPENDILLSCISGDTVVVRGPEHDVLARYAKAAEAVKANVVMRVTSDCPLIDPVVCGQVLTLWAVDNGQRSFGTNNTPRTWPHGFDCEVFDANALKVADRKATSKEDREHVTPYLRRNLPIENLPSPEDRSHLRWTLDTLEDYKTIWNVFQEQMKEAA